MVGIVLANTRVPLAVECCFDRAGVAMHCLLKAVVSSKWFMVLFSLSQVWDQDLNDDKVPWVNSSKNRPSLVDYMLFGLDPVKVKQRAGQQLRRKIKLDLERSALYLLSQVTAFTDRNVEEHTRLPFKQGLRILGGKHSKHTSERVNTVVASVAERLFEGKDQAKAIALNSPQ